MKKNIKRVLSLALVFCMVLGMTANVYATGNAETGATAIETEAETEAAPVEETTDGVADDADATEGTEAGETAEAAGTEAAAEETTEAEAEEGISVASEEVTADTTEETTTSDSDDKTGSVTMYQSGTSTQTITSTTDLGISGGSVTNSEGTTIATYTVESSTVTTYSSYTVGSTVSSVSNNSYYVIGDSSSGYLTVDSSGNLTTSTTVSAYNIWKVVSASTSGGNSTYYLYNEATGYYLVLSGTSSGSGMDSTTTYSLSTSSSSGTAFNFRNNSFCISVSDRGSTNYYYINGKTYSTSSGSSVSSVSGDGDGTTTYIYTITFTGVTAGTGTVTLGGTTYNVTVKTMRTFESGSQSINLSYGWHIANIESVTRTSSGQGPDSDSTETKGYAAVTASQSALSGLYNQAYLTAGDTNVYGWDEAIYGEYDEDGNYDLHVTVYGSDDQENWTEIDMTQSTGTTGSGTNIRGAYEGNTIYDYYYIMIVPDDGYYVSQLVAACNDTAERQTSTFSEVSTVTSYTEVYGSEYLGVYGVGCSTMGSGNSFEAGYEPTAGTSIILDMKTVLAKHYEAGGSLGAEDPYFLLIELAEIPTPLYVEYEAGDGDGYIDADAIVDTTGSYYWANSYVDSAYNTYSTTDEKKDSVSFVLSKSELQELGYQYQVLNPSVTEYTVTENGEEVTYYFTGWEVTYYTTATGTYDGSVDGESGYYYTSEAVTTKQYPYLDGELDMVSSNIEYGSNTSIYLFTHVKFVAQWTKVKLQDVGYVVDFGLPVELDVINQCTSAMKDSSEYGDFTWTISSIGTNPSYGTAVVNSDNTTITYTPTSVIQDATTMTVRLTGQSSSSTITAVVNVTIYPATTVYYEEGFASYGTGTSVTDDGEWSGTTGVSYSDTQETHVVGNGGYSNYNYDSAYTTDTTGSNATNASTTTQYDSLKFTFTGTGVDIFANCVESSGIVVIMVQDSEGSFEDLLTVDMANTGTYASGGTAYNTPIASISKLGYGTHTVTIYLGTDADTRTSGFVFDGFRVYDTIKQDETEGTDAYTIQTTVYAADDEDYPNYYELRNNVLVGLNVDTSSSTYVEDLTNSLAQVYASGELTGAIVTYNSNTGILNGAGNSDEELTVQDLLDDGPKNELYLYPGMTVVFKITTNREVQIGLRSVTGATVSYTVNSGSTETISSSVDMFYDLLSKTSTETTTTITISNTSETGSGAILSITDIKVSDSTDDTIFAEMTADEVVAALTGSASNEDEEEEIVYADAALTVNLVDYTGSVIASTELTDNGVEDESVTFAASDILVAVNEALPDGYALVDEDSITDQTVTYGESDNVSVQIGKVATLVVTYQKYSGLFKKTTVGTATLTKVQTSSTSKATFSASEIKAAVPSGYKVLTATSASVSYGSSATKTVTVY